MSSRVVKTERIARNKVKESTCLVSLAAIVVRGGVPISYGSNKKNHRGYSIHAEVNALNKLKRQKSGAEGADIYVYRFLANGDYGLAKPCPDCMKEIKKSGIKRIFYSDYGGLMKIIKI
jgi:deoxycytidylate deaminase|tara:strand:- start:1051 stop:1407 length:357 start_codon:yes stop_codon:yes gene_type:complete